MCIVHQDLGIALLPDLSVSKELKEKVVKEVFLENVTNRRLGQHRLYLGTRSKDRIVDAQKTCEAELFWTAFGGQLTRSNGLIDQIGLASPNAPTTFCRSYARAELRTDLIQFSTGPRTRSRGSGD